MSGWLPTREPIWIARSRVTKTIAFADASRRVVLEHVMAQGLRARLEVVLLP